MKNLRFINYLILTILISVLFTNCKKDDEKPAPKLPDGEALQEKIEENLAAATQKFTVDGLNGGTIIGAQGIRVVFHTRAFLDDQDVEVTGDIDVELIEIFNKADMLMNNIAPIGRNADGKIATLISGGEFFINATKDGKQLKPNGTFEIQVPAEVFDQDMRIFRGIQNCDEQQNCDIIWEEEDNGLEFMEGNEGDGVYGVFQSQFGWTNIDKWYSDPRPKTTIFVDVPEGYDDTNCAVYVSYDGEPTALARMDVYDETAGLFTEHYGLIPIGLEVHFIVVSIVDDQWNYAIQPATIVNNHIELIGQLSPTTSNDLTNLINSLP